MKIEKITLTLALVCSLPFFRMQSASSSASSSLASNLTNLNAQIKTAQAEYEQTKDTLWKKYLVHSANSDRLLEKVRTQIADYFNSTPSIDMSSATSPTIDNTGIINSTIESLNRAYDNPGYFNNIEQTPEYQQCLAAEQRLEALLESGLPLYKAQMQAKEAQLKSTMKSFNATTQAIESLKKPGIFSSKTQKEKFKAATTTLSQQLNAQKKSIDSTIQDAQQQQRIHDAFVQAQATLAKHNPSLRSTTVKGK